MLPREKQKVKYSWIKGKHGRHFSIVYTTGGFEELREVLEGVEALTGAKPTVILESIGHYHVSVVRFLEEHSYIYIVVNPFISHQAKNSSLRKVKTDAIDAYVSVRSFTRKSLSLRFALCRCPVTCLA
jgi:transposase